VTFGSKRVGTALGVGFVSSNSAITVNLDNTRLIGSAIDGTPDELYLGARPLTANANIDGGILWREN